MIVSYINNEDKPVKVTIIVDFQLEDEEKYQLILSKIGKDEKIKEVATKEFENLKRIKEIKNFVDTEIKREKEKVTILTELKSVKFNGTSIEIVIFSESKSSLNLIESYVYIRLALLEMDEKLPFGITINENCRIIAQDA